MTHYDALGLPPTASQKQIRDRYWELLPQVHPANDGGDEYLFEALQEAYRVIGDPDTRRDYDVSLGLEPRPEPKPSIPGVQRPRIPSDWTENRWQMVDPAEVDQPPPAKVGRLVTALYVVVIGVVVLSQFRSATSLAALTIVAFLLLLVTIPTILLTTGSKTK